MLGIGTALNPFTVRPSYKAARTACRSRSSARGCAIPRCGAKILADKPSEAEVAKLAQFRQLVTTRWDKFFVMGNPPDYEPGPEKSVAAIAAREGRTPDEVAYDYLTRGRPVPVLPGGQLRHRRSRADPRDAQRSGLPARPERRRRALHLDRRCRRAELHADALGARPAARAATCRSSCWSSGRPARPPISSASPTAAGSRRGCAPTST